MHRDCDAKGKRNKRKASTILPSQCTKPIALFHLLCCFKMKLWTGFFLFVFEFIFITIHEIIGGIVECKRKTNKKRKLTKTVLLLHHITKNCGL